MKKKALAALLILCLLLLGALMLLQTAADERIQHAMNHTALHTQAPEEEIYHGDEGL